MLPVEITSAIARVTDLESRGAARLANGRLTVRAPEEAAGFPSLGIDGDGQLAESLCRLLRVNERLLDATAGGLLAATDLVDGVLIRDNGEVLGDFVPTGIRPKFAEKLLVSGIQLPIPMFESAHAL